MSLTSDELNFLVYRYLLESGFIHSGYTFGHESLIAKSNIDGSSVPPGALISFIQKGLQYAEIESHINEDGTETVCDGSFSVLAPHQCQPQAKRKVFPVPATGSALDADFGVLEASFVTLARLTGHADMVTRCAWNPRQGTVLATASADATARLWEVDPADEKAPDANAAPADFFRTLTETKVVLRQKVDPNANNRSVTALEWNRAGTQLATGVFDGRAFVWMETGELRRTLAAHKAAVSALRWNVSGDLIATGSVDCTVMVWDAASGARRQTLACHAGPVLDVDWRDSATFASCGTDGVVCVLVAGKAEPAARLCEHKRDVNSVRWQPPSAPASGGAGSSGQPEKKKQKQAQAKQAAQLLASGSDDGTVRVWRVAEDLEAAKGEDAAKLVWTLSDHEREVTLVRWSPAGDVLASGSLDTTVRLWNPETGKPTAMLNRHLHPVTSLAFSPDGSLLASAAHDRVHVWNVKEGALARTYRAEGGINDLSWDAAGQSLALSLTDASCVVWRAAAQSS